MVCLAIILSNNEASVDPIQHELSTEFFRTQFHPFLVVEFVYFKSSWGLERCVDIGNNFISAFLNQFN